MLAAAHLLLERPDSHWVDVQGELVATEHSPGRSRFVVVVRRFLELTARRSYHYLIMGRRFCPGSWGLVWSLPALLAVAASSARGQDDVRVLVRHFSGPAAERTRAAVLEVLSQQDSLRLVSAGRAQAVAEQIEVGLESKRGKIGVARELDLSAWVEGVVTRRRRRWRIALRVYNGLDGGKLDEATFAAVGLERLLSTLRRALPNRLGDSLELSSPPLPHHTSGIDSEPEGAAEPVAPVQQPGAPRAKPVAAPTGHGTHAPAHSGAHGGSHVTHILSGALPASETHDADESPLEVLGAERDGAYAELRWYPGRHAGPGWFGNLGLDARLHLQRTPGAEIPFGYAFGARWRMALVKHEFDAVLGLVWEPAQPVLVDPPLAPVGPRYDRHLRVGVEARVLIVGNLIVGLRAGVLRAMQTTASPMLGAPQPGFGHELEGYVSHYVTRQIELRLGAAIMRVQTGEQPAVARASSVIGVAYYLGGIAGSPRE